MSSIPKSNRSLTLDEVWNTPLQMGVESIKLYREPGRMACCEVYSRSAGTVEAYADTASVAVQRALKRAERGPQNRSNKRGVGGRWVPNTGGTSADK